MDNATGQRRIAPSIPLIPRATPPTFTAQIHFHQQDEASVFFEDNAHGLVEVVGEIHLFVLFALRQMSNLGTHLDPLAEVLVRTEEGIELFASGQDIGGVRLIRYPGTPGMRQFLLSGQFGSMGNRQASFDMKTRGFGFMWKGMGYYGPVAVTTLLRFLAVRRAKSPRYLQCLAQAGVGCGAAHLARKISVTNQTPLSFAILQPIAALMIAEERQGEEDRQRAEQPKMTPQTVPPLRPAQANELAYKRERWQATETEADREVRATLAAFVSARLASSPGDQSRVLEAGNRIYANHLAVGTCLALALEHPPSRTRISFTR